MVPRYNLQKAITREEEKPRDGTKRKKKKKRYKIPKRFAHNILVYSGESLARARVCVAAVLLSRKKRKIIIIIIY